MTAVEGIQLSGGMTDDDEDMTIHRGSGCFWTDQGYSKPVEMSVRAALAHRLTAILQSRGWRHREAAKATGLPAEIFWHSEKGRLDQVTVGDLIEALTRLGAGILISVGEAREGERGGAMVQGPDDD